MTATRAVVLARGLGTRMRSPDGRASLTEAQRRAADAGMKAMMPIGGRRFLDFVLSAIADAGLSRVALVVPPGHDELKRYYEHEHPPERLAIDFIVQREALGTANAVSVVEQWTAGEPFLVMNSDNIYPREAVAALAALDGPGLPGFDRDDLVRTSNIPAARISAFALIETDADGYLTRVVEKPSNEDVKRASAGALVSMNCWRFEGDIFQACRDVPRSERGEFELPVAVDLAVQRGMRLKVVRARGPVLDLSQRADAEKVARRLEGVTPRP